MSDNPPPEPAPPAEVGTPTTVTNVRGHFERTYMSRRLSIILAIVVLLLTGCNAGTKLKVGYTPPIIPIQVSVDSTGEISLEASYSVVTPIGVFEIEGEQTIYAIRQNNAGRLLMVRLDGTVSLYRLNEGEDFRAEFVGDESLYRKVVLEYDANGDILLELESSQFANGSHAASHTSVSDVTLCTKSDYDGHRCKSKRTTFPNGTEAVYATWQSPDALQAYAEFMRRWYKDGKLLLENINLAGENARWTPADEQSYFVYLSATEGTGKRLFNSSALPSGKYRFELYTNGQLSSGLDFEVQ